MDDPLEEFADLEAELKALRPARPSRQLSERIGRELDVSRVSRPRWIWAALPVAAAVAIGIFLSRPQQTMAPISAAPAVSFRPVAAENVLYSAKDEGLVTLEDGTAARRLRSNYVDTITWKNPRTNASLRWSVPREDIRVVPVNFQ